MNNKLPNLFLIISLLTVFFTETASASPPLEARFTLLETSLPRVHGTNRVDGLLEPATKLSLAIILPLRNQIDLRHELIRLYDPNDPLRGKYLTSPEFDEQFGPSQEDVNAVSAFAEANGLTVARISANRTMIGLLGSAAQVEAAFHVSLYKEISQDGTLFYTADREPTVTAEIASKILGIVGLDSEGKLQPADAHGGSTVSLPDGLVAPDEVLQDNGYYYSGPYGLSPDDTRSVYNLPGPTAAANGSGQTLAVMELDTYITSDISSYETLYNCDVPVNSIGVDSFNTSSTPGSGRLEVEGDIELIAGLAPAASAINVYENVNTFQGYLDIMDQIASDNTAKSISTSWGLSEEYRSGSELMAENQYLEQCATQGQSVFAASGDSGSNANQTSTDVGTLSVWDPAAQPYMTAVGGTYLNDSATEQYVSEEGWYDSSDTGRGIYGTGGGGGASDFWTIPDYQNNAFNTLVNPQGSTTMRNVPDVSLFGDYDEGGYAIYYEGSKYWYFNGTSAAAPLWAAFTAIVNQQRAAMGFSSIGFLNSTIYPMAENNASYQRDFNDVTTGDNGYYNAVPGYDNATGWGSFSGSNLLADLVSSNSPPKITSFTPVAGPVGTKITITGTNLTGASAVKIGGTPASSVAVLSATSITAVVASGTATGPVSITAPGGTATSAASFTVLSISNFHLSVSSAAVGSTVAGRVTLSADAPSGGTVVQLSSTSACAPVPASVTVPAGSNTVTFAFVAPSPGTATVTAALGSGTATATLTVFQAISNFHLSASSAVLGTAVSGRVTLTANAPAGGTVVDLKSSSSVATVPATLTITAGTDTATFPVTLVSSGAATITAMLGSSSATATLTVTQAIENFHLASSTATVGSAIGGRVTLAGNAPIGGTVVTLSSSSTCATVPATLTIPAGTDTATFSVAAVSSGTATITATVGSSVATATLTVSQAIENFHLASSMATAGTTVGARVTLTANAPPGGTVVTLSSNSPSATVPATLEISAGTDTATFSVTAVSAGAATITAALGASLATAPLTVVK